MAEINIPINDLNNLVEIIKEAMRNIDEANTFARDAYAYICDGDTYNGAAKSNLELIGSSIQGNYDKLSVIYSTLFQYLFGVAVDYGLVDEWIAKYIDSQY